jgi:cyclophilin family peptidyl-prolyl cis-trans isomerase
VVKNTCLVLFLLGLCILSSAKAAPRNTPKVVIETNSGEIAIELFANDAPITVDNFLQYVNSGFYDGLLFHRIIEDFMIQGGGFYLEDNIIYPREPNEPIVNESYNNLSNIRGTIAMARTSDPNSATSQFYINHVDNLFLDRDNAADGYGYCVFGRVLTGMDVVDTIAQTSVVYINPSFTHFPWPTIVEISQASVAPPGYWLSTDLDNNGIANYQDFATLALNWQKTAAQQPGDLDGDGTVDSNDLAMFAYDWLQTTTWYPITQADLNTDSIVNFRDFALLAADWFKTGNDFTGDLNSSRTVNLKDLELLADVWLRKLN